MPALTEAARAYDKAYEQMKISQAEKSRLELEKLQLDVAEKRRQQEMASPSGRVTAAAEAAAALEQDKQMAEGIQIGPELAKRSIEAGGPSLLQATKMQGEMDVESKVRQAKRDALTSFLMGEQSLVPTAKVDVGGITQTVPAGAAPTAMADIQAQAYNAGWPKISSVLQDQGYSKEDADRQAKQMAASQLMKNANNGKIDFEVGNSVISVPIDKAMQMYKDPSTPKKIREKLMLFFGEPEVPAASSWVNTRLGR
jgi:hypothetical protein